VSIMHARWSRLYRSTAAELALEDAVAAIGVPYRGQFPGFLYGLRYFVDFLLPTLNLVIEVDDPSHNTAEKQITDAERTAALQRVWGVRVVRCTNEEAITDPHGTVRRLLSEAGLWPLPARFKLQRVADCMPRPAKCPPRLRRVALRASRGRRIRTKLKRKG
jgi:very-short-patch-repair endonuclease